MIAKKELLFASMICLLVSCASRDYQGAKRASADKAQPLVDAKVKLKVRTGKVAFAKVTFRRADGPYELTCGGKKYPFMVQNKIASIYIPANYFSSAKTLACRYEEDGKTHEVLDIVVTKFDYPKEKLNVAKSKVDYSKKDLERILREKEITEKVYEKSSQFYLFNRPFMTPLNSFVTSYYGNQRLFNNKKKSQHLGNDLRAATGTPIPVSNRGRVVFVGDLFFTGKVVIVDHGMGIFTLYGHLSEIKATEGSIVKQGDIVGLAGATGRVSGPHLHWGVKMHGSWVDGFSLVDESKKHFVVME